jgi:aminoglycoside 6-adenylyltransferase
MRSEKEMMDLILGTAREDARIRVVIMNGSRANPDAKRDIFQDYDIVYIVRDVAPYVDNLKWIERFGDMMILQMPEARGDPPGQEDGRFVYLMQFADGNRIDLTIFPIDHIDQLEKDSHSILLLDKDGSFPDVPPPSDVDYLPKPPTAKQYADCCNEFWWVSAYVAKGLWREELTYAKGVMDTWVRDQLMKMLTWHMGIKTDFKKPPGKLGKHFQAYLEPELWKQLTMIYPDADYDHIWDSLFIMGDMFRSVAQGVGAHFGYTYPEGDDQRVTTHLWHVRLLPKDAGEMY